MKEYIRMIKFLLFSISAGIIEIVSFTILNEFFHFPYWICYLVGLILSVLWNFTLNREYTFRSDSSVEKAMFQVFLFYLIFVPTSTYLEKFLTEELLWNEYIVTILNMVINFITEFLYQRYYVYKDSLDTKKG